MNDQNTTGIKTGELFQYRSTSDDLVKVDDPYIDSIPVHSVQCILRTIRNAITKFESVRYNLANIFTNIIETYEDVVFRCTAIHRWRKGFAFVFLQISQKNGGSARITVFTTTTVHHLSDCFGSAPPSAADAKSVLVQHTGNIAQLVKDLENLKQYHDTKITASDLAKNIQI